MQLVIVTINDFTNYGNRLQNYALTCVLQQHGTVVTLDYRFANSVKHKIKTTVLSIFHSCTELLFCFARFRAFRLFNSYIKFIKRIPNSKKECIFVLGSDQIWNYHWFTKQEILTLLGANVYGKKKLSYAASFGISEVSEAFVPCFQTYLPTLSAISVREDRGAELVKKMTGLDATVVLDPTLMLDTNQWNQIFRGFVSDDDRYILTYFLGKPSDQQEKTILEYANAHGCRIRRILDLRDRQTYKAGPQDFVELFSKAQYVFTDSYHACCFSILYHKQFTVFNRAGMEGKANMNSRMETLFRLFDLDNVTMDNGVAPQIDYLKVDRLLAQHRAESQTWLNKALEV